MAEGRSRSAWSHTSSVLALLFNINRDPKKAPAATPGQFNPHVAPRRKRGLPMDVGRFADDVMALAGEKRAKKRSL